MPNLDNQTIQLALVAAVALAMLIQAIVLFAALIALRKLAKSIRQEIDDLRSSVMPLIENTRNLLARVAPKIEQTASDLALLTRALLDAVDRAGSFMADTVTKPMRQLSAFLASAKAVIESLRSTQGASRAEANRASSDNDLFV